MSLTKATYSMITGAYVNALDYGADPTGSSDSQAAIQSALNSGGNVFLPKGNYKINSTLSFVNANQVLFGESFAGINVITSGNPLSATNLSQIFTSSAITMFTHGNLQGVQIENIAFNGNAVATAGVSLGTSGQPFNITLRNVFVNAINGIALNTGNCVDSNFYSVIVNGYNASSTVVTTDGILVGSTNNNFYGCWVEGCTNGIYAVGTIAHFFGCTLSDAPYTNIKIGANIAQYSFNGCYLENAVVIYSNSSYSYGCVDFVNCFIESSSTSNLIDLTNCASGSQVNFIGGRFSELSGSQNIYIPSGVSVNCINVGQSTPTFSGAGTFTLLSNTSNSTAQAVFPASVSVSGTVAKILSGTGSPQGVVAAPVGSIFLRTDGGTSTTFYVKETGTTTSSGWVAK